MLYKKKGGGAFQVTLVEKNSPANAGDTRDMGLSPGSGRSPGVGSSNHSSILACKFHGQRSLEGCSPWSCKESDTIEHIH